MSTPQQPGSNLYPSSFGTTSSNSFPGNAIRATRPPSTTDVRGPQGNYTIGQLWVDTDSESSFQLVNLTSSNSVVTASWVALGGGSSALSQLSGDTGTAFPVGGNINIIGGSGVTTAASGDNVTISLTGGGEAIDTVALNAGTSPIAPDGSGQISILASATAAAGIPIQTVGTAADTATIEVQYASTTTATTATAAGIASFNSSDFTVDASGFVSAIGGGFARSVDVDSSLAPGTDPVVPNASGTITVTGAQVSSGGAGTQGINTFSGAANTWAIQVQRSAATTTTTTSLNGLAHFSSSDFTVDGNGFVTAIGGGFARSVEVDDSSAPGTDPVLPSASGTITVTAAQVASGSAGAEGIQTFSGAANTWAVQIQRSASTTVSTTSLCGTAHFNSADFTVDANGFVSAIGGGFARSVNVDTSSAPGTDPVVPNSSGTITVTGGQVTPGTTPNVIQTASLTANEWQIQIQRANTTATEDVSLNGVCHFNSANFSVTEPGFVSLLGTIPAITSGTFTPTLAFGGTSVGIAYASQVGRYILIGTAGSGQAIIMYSIDILLSNKGSSVGSVTIGNLPISFNPSGDGLNVPILVENLNALTNQIVLSAAAGNLIAVYLQDTSGGSVTTLQDTDVTNTTRFTLTMIGAV